MAHLGGGSGRAGVAALEFALLVPVLAALFLGVADFSTAYHYQMQLSSALAAGAQYAFTKGQGESGTALTTDVTNFITSVSAVHLSSVTASYNNGQSATSCYCVSGSPAVYTGPLTCGTACTDGSGSTAGKYVSISGGFSYTAMFSVDQVFFANPLVQTVTVRLQ